MIDRCGRTIDYLRISVTDRCNLRCIYCMPEDGVKLVDRSLILREEEIIRICRVMAELEITRIKLTGGEPRDPCSYAGTDSSRSKRLPGIQKVTLTTNGILLKEQMKIWQRQAWMQLISAWIRWTRECFRKIARRDLLDQSLEGIQEALRYPQITVKINCVPLGIEGDRISVR